MDMDKDTTLIARLDSIGMLWARGLISKEAYAREATEIQAQLREIYERRAARAELQRQLLAPFEQVAKVLDRFIASLLRPIRRWMQRWRS
jgi:hypothetical protein